MIMYALVFHAFISKGNRPPIDMKDTISFNMELAFLTLACKRRLLSSADILCKQFEPRSEPTSDRMSVLIWIKTV